MSVEIIFKEKEPELFWQYWQEVVDRAEASYLYLPLTLKGRLIVSKDRNSLVDDKSFVYLVDNKPVAGIFLPLEKSEKNTRSKQVSISNSYVDAPLFVSDQGVEKKVFNIIDDIAGDNNVGKIMFALDAVDESASYNYLQNYGYLDTSILNYVVDLSLSEDLLGNCRENHRRNIKKIIKDNNFRIFYIDKNNPSLESHNKYVKLHHKCSGRITRPLKTFDLYFEELKQGNAALFGLKHKEKSVAYVYCGCHINKAIYASGADDPDFTDFPLYHILLFKAMEYFKERGVKYFDMSQPSAPSSQLDYYPDKKQLNIALFKRGFGGEFRMKFRGIKYFSEEAFENDAKKFIDNYPNIFKI